MPVFAVLTTALAAAPCPDGDITGRDREIVARLTRGGLQRLDADAGHGLEDAVEPAVAAAPSADPLVASVTAGAPGHVAIIIASPVMPPPQAVSLVAVRLDLRPSLTAARRRARPRAPPLA